MSQLVRGMYGTEFTQASNLFGLACGQMCSRHNKLTHNSGWYNKRGEKLGWGDLSANDFQRIAAEIADNELFIVLSEQASFWNFFNKGRPSEKAPTEAAPGIEYVAAHAMFLIAKGQLCSVNNFRETQEEERAGLRFKVISNRELAKRMHHIDAL